MLVNVNVESDYVVDLLIDRVKFWTDDKDVVALYEQYYTELLESERMVDIDVMYIVDNDVINWFSVMDDEELTDQFPDDTEEERQERVYATHNGLNLVYMC